MKLVQIGILVCLVAIAGLLGTMVVTNNRTSETTAEETTSETLQLAIESARSPEPALPVAEAPPQSEPKPQPVRPVPPRRQPSAAATPPKPSPQAEPKPEPAPEPAAVPVGVKPATLPHDPRPIEIAGLVHPEPEPARVPRQVTLPAGTDLPVRLDYALSSERNFSGDSFTASLERAVVIDDMVIAEKGARVEGRVVEAIRAGRVKGRAELSLELIRLDTADGQTVDLVSNRLHREGPGTVKSDATKVGIGAGVGALIGAIAGGGKGAAIGAGVGAGAGGGAAAATRGKPAEVPAEERLDFRLMEAVRIIEKL